MTLRTPTTHTVPLSFNSYPQSSILRLRPLPPIMPSPPEHEVLFLTLHHLHTYDSDPAVASALSSLENAFNSLHKLPTALHYNGTQYSQTYSHIAARHPHIPPSYLNQVLRARLPHGSHAPRTLLATGRYSTVPGKPSSSNSIEHVKRRLRPISKNVATILDQQSFLSVPPPFHRISLALLPKAFRPLKRLVGHHLPVFTTIFDHTGRYIITGSDDHLIKVWSTETAYLQHTLRGHDSDIIEIVKHPTRPILVSASSDTTLRVWDVNTGEALHVLDGGSKEVNAVQFSPCPDRPYLVSGGADGTVRLWNGDDFEAGFLRIPIPNRFIVRHATDTRHAGSAATSRAAPPSPANDTSLPQPPSQLAVPSNSTHPAPSDSQQPSSSPMQANTPASAGAPAPRSELLRDTARHAANSVVSGTPLYEVLSVCFNAGATRLAVSGTDCVAHVYAVEKSDSSDSSLPTVRLLTSLRGHSEHIIQVLFSRSGDTIVTACRDGTARMWKRTKARLPGARSKKESVVGMGSWSSKVLDCRSQIQADARSLLSGAASGSACGSIVPRMRRASFPVSLCAAMWSRNDKYLLTSSTDTKIRIWHGESGQLARVLEAHEREVYVMDCHPTDERILLSAGYDGRCILWDIETGAQLRTFSIANHVGELETPGSENGSAGPPKRPDIVDGQFSSDGLSFVVSDTSGAISLFGVGSGEATALAPEEQFFSDDCAPFRRDSKQRAVHESTGVLLHLAPKGRLCDKELRPHPPELQANLSFVTNRKAAVSVSSDPQPDRKRPSDSPNTVRNRNRDALLQRAKEFRDNQQKEERRLLREARNARRRMIIEKEKACLERDKPFYMPLRDFEVPDSDYEDSDEDFDGDGYISGDSESSSSSEEDDEDDEVRDGGRKRKRREIQEAKTKSYRKLESAGTKRRRPLRRSPHKDVEDSNSTESSESDGEEESPGYVDSQESDSDNSEPTREGRRRVSNREQSSKGEPRISDGQMSNGRQLSTGKQCPPSEALAPSAVRQHPPSKVVPGLLGSSMTRSDKRMKITLTGKEQIDYPVQTAASTPSAPNDLAVDFRVSPVDVVPPSSNVNGAQSIGSHHGQGQPCDAIGFAGFHTPLNPSFTSERKEDPEGSPRMSKPVEDHQGDTASCFRPRRMVEELVDVTRPSQGDQAVQYHSSAAKSPETEKGQHHHGMDVDAKPDISKAMVSISKLNGKTDGIEKSSLSDSPARITRRKWRNRTRQGSANGGNSDGQDHLVDIDELAERELEILDSQHSRRRHRRKRKRYANRNSSEGDCTGDETGSQHHRASRDGLSDDLKHRRNKTKREGLCKSEAEDLRSGLNASTWLRLTSNKHTYVPQLGDDVMYFPEGHAAAMEVSKAMGLEPLMDKTLNRKFGKEVLDGTTFGKGTTPLRFVISELTYEFPMSSVSSKNSRTKSSQRLPDQRLVKTKTMVVLTLRLISGGKRRVVPNDRFILSYFPVDAPEYLVLTSKVETALNRSWKASDRVRILFLNERRAWQYYTGTIRSVKPTLRSVMWNTVEVEYDNTEVEKEKVSVDLVSPWELEPHDLFQGTREMAQPFPQLIRASTVEPGLFPIIARELETIRQMEANWRTQLSWLDTVDSIAATDGYCDSIPCPMDLDTVLVRMCTGYYRHFCAYLHDISLLKSNAIHFHGPRSEKGVLASNVLARIADTSERIRAQFLASFMSVSPAQPYHSPTSGAYSASKAIRPRPSPNELTGSVGTVPGQSSSAANGRQFPVPLTPRQSSAGLALGHHHDNSGYHVTNPALSSRIWSGIRLTPGVAQQQQLVYANTSLGVALPPVLPVVASAGVTARGGRSVRASARGQGLRQSGGPGRRVNATSLTRGQPVSPPVAAASLVPAMNTGSPPGVPSPYVAAHANQVAYQQSQVRMVANSSQTNSGRGAARKVTPTGTRTQARKLSRPNVQSSEALDNTNTGTDTMLMGHNRGYPVSGTISPRLAGNNAQAAFAPLSIGQPSTQGPQMRANRGGSTAGEGGTHSWSRSMEGAGGVFPLQASTSDSHLPVPPHGRPRSPVSPSPTVGEVASVQQQQGSSVAANAGSRYREHSTVSIAAAESTMSCGGAELQAATAESADVGSEKPS